MSIPSRSTLVRQSAEYILGYLAAHPGGKSFLEIQEACILQGKQGLEIFGEAFGSIANQLVEGTDEKIFLKVTLPRIDSRNIVGVAANPQGDEKDDRN